MNDRQGTIKVLFKKLSPGAKIPTSIGEGNVGFDVYCDEEVAIPSMRTKKISSGIQLADASSQDIAGNSIFLKIEGRSGLAARGVFPIGGIVDISYRGTLGIMLANMSDVTVIFKPGDRIAQLVVYKVGCSPEVLMAETDVVAETTRGSAGFGSSGA